MGQANLSKGTSLKDVTFSVLQEIDLNILSAVEKDGTAIAVHANGANPQGGWTVSEESNGVRWNNTANPDPIMLQCMMPTDLDSNEPIVVNFLASKIGATLADAVIWDCEAFFTVDAALYDADVDAGGDSSAMTGDAATKTTQLETRTIAAADIPSGPCKLSLTIQPKDGTLGTDDVILHGVWLSYTKKLTTLPASV